MASEKTNGAIHPEHTHRHTNLRLGVFGFGCVGQGLYHVLHETKGVKAEIKKICVKHKNKQRPLAEDIFTYNKDEILNVKNEVEGFVPFQQILNQKSKLTFDNLPRTSGNFGIYKKEILLDEISFNYPRTENSSEFTEKSVFNDFKIVNSINSFFDDIRFNRVDNQIWKWFLAFALVFLCLEILIQKFVK